MTDQQIRFSDLGLCEPLLFAIDELGFEAPTRIQAQAIPAAMQGRDVLGAAHTGSGKTAAFALPILQGIAEKAPVPDPRRPVALVLAPTRELVIQIKETFDSLSTRLGVHTAVLVGGLSMRPQVTALERGPLVVVATPGRLLDHIRQRTINLDRVAYFVLDEADRMLDMGFQDQIDAILRKLPKQRQTLLFSATMDNAMTGLVRTSVREPVLVDVSDEVTEVPQVEHKFLEIVEPSKRRALRELLAQEPGTVLVFVNMKSRATMLSRYLGKEGFQATEIHGDLDQKARMRSLEAFRSGDARILVATDVAARGIDIEAIAHVVNFDMPLAAEDFVHRIGRTARAGATGRATSFVTVGDREMAKRVLRMLHERAPAPEVPAAGPPAPQFGRKARKVQSRKGPSRGVRLF